MTKHFPGYAVLYQGEAYLFSTLREACEWRDAHEGARLLMFVNDMRTD
jgi:hypothetical protein